MATLSSKFRETGQRLVLKFTVGNCTLRLPTENYNATTGVAGRTPNTQAIVPYCLTGIDISKVMTSSMFDAVVIVAGLDVEPFVVKVGTLIDLPNGDTLIVEEFKTDQFGAAYFLGCNKL